MGEGSGDQAQDVRRKAQGYGGPLIDHN